MLYYVRDISNLSIVPKLHNITALLWFPISLARGYTLAHLPGYELFRQYNLNSVKPLAIPDFSKYEAPPTVVGDLSRLALV